MWVRLTAMLICIVFFITGCNSLISQFFGTHKLRIYSIEEAITKGIGDSDFVEITGAWQTGDYIVVPPRNESDKPILIFPLLSEQQLREMEKGEQVAPRFIAWTKNFSIECDEQKTCAPKLGINAQGVIREMLRQKNKAHMLSEKKYVLPDNVNYIEVGRQPLEWYWNLLMVIAGLGVAFYIEVRANRLRKIGGSEVN
jgi:hypothetical protein